MHVHFSSPEPKAQVSFSEQNLSAVCRPGLWRSRRRLFTFLSFSPQLLGPLTKLECHKASIGKEFLVFYLNERSSPH